MTPKNPTLRLFTGREIAAAIVQAVEAIPADCEVVTFKAGENMPITSCFCVEGSDETILGFPEYAWDGEGWRNIGHL